MTERHEPRHTGTARPWERASLTSLRKLFREIDTTVVHDNADVTTEELEKYQTRFDLYIQGRQRLVYVPTATPATKYLPDFPAVELWLLRNETVRYPDDLSHRLSLDRLMFGTFVERPSAVLAEFNTLESMVDIDPEFLPVERTVGKYLLTASGVVLRQQTSVAYAHPGRPADLKRKILVEAEVQTPELHLREHEVTYWIDQLREYRQIISN